MPINLHEKTEEFRLVDVNGVMLANPNDYIKIPEPDGFDSIDITLSRDRDNHGFNFEFTDPEKKYGFDRVLAEGQTLSGYQLLDQLFNLKGVNAVCYFEYYTINYGVFTLQIRAKIEFDTRSRKFEKLEFATSRVNLSTTINRRFDDKISMLATESLDGEPITGVTPVDVYTHSQRFKIEGELNNFSAENQVGRDSTFYFPGPTISETQRFNTVNFICHAFPSVTNELQLFGYQGQVIFDNGEQARGLDGFFLFNAPDDGVYDIDWRSPASEVTVQYQNDLFDDTIVGEINVFYKIGEEGTPQLIDSVNGVFVGDAGVFPEVNFRIDIDTIVFQKKISLKRGDNFYIYYEYKQVDEDINNNPRLRSIAVNVLFSGGVFFKPGGLLGFTKIEAFTTAPTTKTPSYYYWEAFNHVLEGITSKTNVLDSAFFDRLDRGALADGGGGQNVLTNGFLLRNFTNDKGVRLSFADVYEHAKSVFGIGFQAGEDKVLMQRIQDFYQDKQIMKLQNVYDITDNFDPEYTWNKITIGFNKYTDGDEFERVNTLDEIHTEHEYSLPLDHKNDLALFSPIAMSGYLIEITRRLSFAETVSESWKLDDEIFGIAVKRYDEIVVGAGQDSSLMIRVNALFGDDFFGLVGDWKFLENETDLVIVGGGYAGTYTINNVKTIVEESSEQVYTYIYVDEVLSALPILVTTGTITLSTTYINSEKNEPFDSVTGVISPNTIYNGRHNIKNMLYNSAPLINSGLNYNDNADLVRNTFYKNNGDAALQFKVGDGFNTLDPDRLNVTQKANLRVDEINQRNRLFLPIIVSLSCPLGIDDINYIKDACLNQNADDVNFGYVAYDDDFGVERKIFITELKYTPKTNVAQIVGILKYDAP